LNAARFKEFKRETIHSLKDLNDQCARVYRISTWPQWNYKLEDATLVFSEAGIPRVVTSVQVVGTTSTKEKNWLWGWANGYLPPQVVSRMEEVRRFGKAEGIRELTEPYWPDDQYFGWAMTAIAAHVVGAKGAYRTPEENGFMYFVFMDIRLATRDEELNAHAVGRTQLKCGEHDEGFATYVCEHLIANPSQEWFSAPPSESNLWPDAWCARCDLVLQEQGEWNERNEGRTKIKLVCHRCYEAMRKMET
jgi:uncharacterized protein DUF6882